MAPCSTTVSQAELGGSQTHPQCLSLAVRTLANLRREIFDLAVYSSVCESALAVLQRFVIR